MQQQILIDMWVRWLLDPHQLPGERSWFTSPRTSLDVDPQPSTVPPASTRPAPLLTRETLAGMLPRSMRSETRTQILGPKPLIPAEAPRPITTERCRCEQDDRALLLYRSIEFGFDLSPEVLEWLPEAVAAIERACPASVHYHETMLSEWLAQDVETDADDYEAAAVEFWQGQDEDTQTYLGRTEMGGRFMEAVIEAADEADERTVAGMRTDADTNDWTSLIRSREMTKRRELFDTLIALGVRPIDAAPWVKARIAVKRADAIRAKRDSERASLWTEGFPLPPESQIRLRAYASCLAALAKSGADAITKTWKPVETTRYREEPTTGLTTRQREKLAARRERSLAVA